MYSQEAKVNTCICIPKSFKVNTMYLNFPSRVIKCIITL